MTNTVSDQSGTYNNTAFSHFKTELRVTGLPSQDCHSDHIAYAGIRQRAWQCTHLAAVPDPFLNCRVEPISGVAKLFVQLFYLFCFRSHSPCARTISC